MVILVLEGFIVERYEAGGLRLACLPRRGGMLRDPSLVGERLVLGIEYLQNISIVGGPIEQR